MVVRKFSLEFSSHRFKSGDIASIELIKLASSEYSRLPGISEDSDSTIVPASVVGVLLLLQPLGLPLIGLPQPGSLPAAALVDYSFLTLNNSVLVPIGKKKFMKLPTAPIMSCGQY